MGALQKDATDHCPARPSRRTWSRCAARSGSPENARQSTGRDRCRNTAVGSRYRPTLPQADQTAEHQGRRSRESASSRSPIRRRNTPLADDAGHWPDHSHGANTMGIPQRRTAWLVAQPHDGPQAADVARRRLGKQDGTRDLGLADQERRLSGSRPPNHLRKRSVAAGSGEVRMSGGRKRQGLMIGVIGNKNSTDAPRAKSSLSWFSPFPRIAMMAGGIHIWSFRQTRCDSLFRLLISLSGVVNLRAATYMANRAWRLV